MELLAFLDGQYTRLRVAGNDELYRIETDRRELNDLIVSGMTRPEEQRLGLLRAELALLPAS